MQIKEKKSIKPRCLMPGDTVGIAAPAGPFDPTKFMKGKAVLESMGFRTFFDEGIFQKHGFFAGTDVQRADQVNRLFADPAVQAVICARGGYGSMRILRFLDFKIIQNNPKIFVGFSDISVLLFILHARCSLVTFHGPVVTTLANTDKQTIAAMLKVMTADKIFDLKPEKGIALKPGVCSGVVVGGNLTTLCHLAGTPYTPNFNGKILFLEDRGEAPYRIDRMLTQMKLAGCFEGLKGLFLGSFEACGKLDDIFRIVQEVFNDVNIPILSGFEIGHARVNITIPIGLRATLDADRQILTFHEPATVTTDE
ncbi:MAG: LD-carboxypeptidase [Deltaproteobacteria bacterium]|nr:LD-carboxypeptidase [Deltaproteobacteria bacterium]MBW2598165.1 LD-carboxypeptidase [Deltaproteobacteria bacterium]MBW2639204.1 LD-carboxypeptidase [Deltaproteobacteria bacterium]MBW2679823.1 LD-carboxypeptidase [Deltaproteobacteria bacterium]